jgi:hypothetical protein
MTHKQFVNKPKSKTSKEYDHKKYQEKSKLYRDMPSHICECGIKTLCLSKHMKSTRHIDNMMKRDPIKM